MGWRLRIFFTDGSEELVDDVFDSEEEAQEEFKCWYENWGAGRETLMLAGEDYIDADIEDCEIWEE